jgi:succinate dehydrogenase / fumarate reductase membrane anchor subunit
MLIAFQPVGYAQWREWFSHPIVNVAAALFFVALSMHAWVGMRDVILDYLHKPVWRFTALLGVAFVLSAALLGALRVLWALTP